VTPSSVNTLRKRHATVCWLMNSRSPISEFDRPSPASRATCASWPSPPEDHRSRPRIRKFAAHHAGTVAPARERSNPVYAPALAQRDPFRTLWVTPWAEPGVDWRRPASSATARRLERSRLRGRPFGPTRQPALSCEAGDSRPPRPPRPHRPPRKTRTAGGTAGARGRQETRNERGSGSAGRGSAVPSEKRRGGLA
jgi:hypothetical protein